MFKRLLRALAHVKSKSMLNEILQTRYSFYWAKETTKKVYNNIINSMKI